MNICQKCGVKTNNPKYCSKRCCNLSKVKNPIPPDLVLIKNLDVNSNHKSIGLFKCSCGNQFTSLVSRVRNGVVFSCGCKKKVYINSNYKHGECRTKLYKRWSSMHRRCRKNYVYNKHYYMKGITVCDRWNSFELFKLDMQNGFDEKLSLDRIDNNKGYSPENCRWATPIQQMNNTSRTFTVEYNGGVHPVQYLSKQVGIPAKVIRERITKLKWSVQDALNTPMMTK